LEIIVSDNASTDRTCAVVGSIAAQNVTLIRSNSNAGMFENFNRCLEAATGEYLCLLCSDDILLPGFLAAGMAHLDANPGDAIYSGRGVSVNDAGGVIGPVGHHFAPGRYPGQWAIGETLKFLGRYAYNPLNYMDGMLFRTCLAKQTKGFDSTYSGGADMDFTFAVLDFGDLFIADRETLRVGVHDSQQGRQHEVRLKHITEMMRLAESRRHLLKPDEVYETIRTELAAVGFGFGLHALLTGRTQAAKAHFDISRQLESSLLRRIASLVGVAARHFGSASHGVPLVFPPTSR
jgi:glycosyltransferase involved in cell wall biosynthesis